MSKRGGDDNEGIQLKQVKGGNVLTVTIGKRKQEDKCEINAEVTAKLKKRLDLSERDTIKMLIILRKNKVKVEKNVMRKLKEIGSCLEEEYENVIMEFEATMEEEVEMEDGTKKKSKKKII